MQISAELRFWWTGELKQFEEWFRSGPYEPGGGGDRVDVYLRSESEELGIKRRGKKPGIEIKSLVADDIVLIGCPSVHGQIWVKSSSLIELPESGGFALTKRRHLRKFATSDGKASELPLGPDETPLIGALPSAGCNVELTNVRASQSDREWMTLGFESFGSLESVVQSLELTLRSLPPLPNLDDVTAASYPKWLLRSSHAPR